jgi:predicted ester cyclase
MKLVTVAALVLASVSAFGGDQAPAADSPNVAVVKRYYAAINRGDAKAAAAEFADDGKNFGRAVGRQGLEARIVDILKTFPDWHMEILEIADAGDVVVVRCKVSGTHRGVGTMSMNNMPVGAQPTGKRFEVTHMHWHKLRDGAIVEHYANRDDLGMLRQLGLVPPDTRK